MRSKKADEKDTNAQFWKRKAEEDPSIREDDPEGSCRDGLDQVGGGDLFGRIERLLKDRGSDNVKNLLDEAVSALATGDNAMVLSWQRAYPGDGKDEVFPARSVLLQATARNDSDAKENCRHGGERPCCSRGLVCALNQSFQVSHGRCV